MHLIVGGMIKLQAPFAEEKWGLEKLRDSS